MKQTYIEMAQEMQEGRDPESRLEDPILPTNLASTNVLVKQGCFVAKGYCFFYQIHSDGTNFVNDPGNNQPNICWSLFARLGKQTEMVWKFHRFSNAVLQEVYPNYKDYYLNVNSQLSLYNMSENDTQDDIIGARMNPVDKLGKYIAYVGKLLAV